MGRARQLIGEIFQVQSQHITAVLANTNMNPKLIIKVNRTQELVERALVSTTSK